MKNIYFNLKPLFVFGCVMFSFVAKAQPERANNFSSKLTHAVAQAKKQVTTRSAAVKSFAQKKKHAFIASANTLRNSAYSRCNQLAVSSKQRINRIKRKAISGIISINGRCALAQDIFIDYVEEHPYQAGIAATVAVIGAYKLYKKMGEKNNKED